MVAEPTESSHEKSANVDNSVSKRTRKRLRDEKEQLIREIMLMAKVTSTANSLRTERRSKDLRRKSTEDDQDWTKRHYQSKSRKRRKVQQNPLPTSDDEENEASDPQIPVEQLSAPASESNEQQAIFESILCIKEESFSEITHGVEDDHILEGSNETSLILPEMSHAEDFIDASQRPCGIFVKEENADYFDTSGNEASQPVVLLSSVLRNLPL